MDQIRPSAHRSMETVGLAIRGSTAHRSTGTALNTAATVALSADTQRGIVIGGVIFSYKGTTTPTGRLTIESGSETLFDVDINNDQVNQIDFDPPLLCGKSEAVTITLGAGGAAATGKVNCLVWKMD